ncbi:MAG: DUF4434 domain-containing protein [Thiotrichales bacterium]
MNFHTNKFAVITVLLAVMLFSGLTVISTAQESQVEPLQQPEAPIAETTFLQLWGQHANIGKKHWLNLFTQLQAMGFDEVIVQWSQYGEHRYTEPNNPLLRYLIDAASKTQTKLWIGLSYDPDFWHQIEHRSLNKLDNYFASRLETNQKLLADIGESFNGGKANPVAGIYIADEIDDTNWIRPQSRQCFRDYIKSVSDQVVLYTPVRRIAISSFSNGRSSSDQYAEYISELIAETGVTNLLFQDGVGAKKLSIKQAALFAKSLKSALSPDIRTSVIVELFNQTAADNEFKAHPAPSERVASQLKSANLVTPGAVVVFSAPDYLLKGFSGKKTALGSIWPQISSISKKNTKPSNEN